MLVLAVCLLISQPVFADTYQISNLGNSGAVSFYGMDDSGDVVLYDSPTDTYNLFVNGVLTANTLTPPDLSYDNGTSTTPAGPAGITVLQGVSNNGNDAFFGYDPTWSVGKMGYAVYVGSGDDATMLAQGGLSGPGGNTQFIFMNSNGGVVWEDDFSENWYVAYASPLRAPAPSVPEPGSLALLGTGALGLFGTLCRRIYR